MVLPGSAGRISVWSLKGNILIIAEKPKAARKIAEALSGSNGLRVHRKYNVTYYELPGLSQRIFIASASGHLFELATDKNSFPVFEYRWVPAYIVNESKRYTANYLKLLSELCRSSEYFINACDYDIEGSVIGYLIIRNFGKVERSLRAKFSSLTYSELRASFQNLSKLDYEMVEAGLCRHELDWLWGINVSRALMHSIKVATGKKYVLSAGRVQTPTLKYAVEKSLERNLFIPLPLYGVKVTVRVDGKELVFEYEKNPLERLVDAEQVAREVKAQKYLVVESFSRTTQRLNPPPPFNLGDLQEEAARIFGMSPYKTQSIAEELYLDALISYPRTNSQKLPPTLNYMDIVKKLGQNPMFTRLVGKLLEETRGSLRPVEGEKEDPAHPAIYPTGTMPVELRSDQKAIYELIVRRFLATFARPAELSQTKIVAVAPHRGYRFYLTGREILYEGWLVYYNYYSFETTRLPTLNKGERLEVVDVTITRDYTRPPKPLSKIDLLRWMESVEIGTESTRATIIEKLFQRKYLTTTGSRVDVTDLGYGVIEVLEVYFPALLSVDLTRKFEKLMNDIRSGNEKRERVVSEAKFTLEKLLREFETRAKEVGLMLSARLGMLDVKNKCSIPGCNREQVQEGLCKIHLEALRRTLSSYEEWRRRVGDIEFEEYLRKISKMKITGKWVKELIESGVIKKWHVFSKHSREF